MSGRRGRAVSEAPPAADHFGRQAARYAHARPDYPAALFDALAAAAPGRALAWDCGAGSGQASAALAARFAAVVATDASPAQLAHARPARGVHYVAARAEACPLPDASADLVTVAQALHWFDGPAFHAEAHRVLRPGGVAAAWTYGDARLAQPAADAVLRHFDRAVVGADWPAERAHVRDGYRTLDFPFAPVALDVPATLERRWTADEIVAYAATWSATIRHADRTGDDPLGALARDLRRTLGTDAVAVRWPLVVLAGGCEGQGRAPAARVAAAAVPCVSDRDRVALRRGRDLQRTARRRRERLGDARDPVDLHVLARGRVVEEHQPRHPGVGGEAHRLGVARVAPAAVRGELRGEVGGVVDEHVRTGDGLEQPAPVPALALRRGELVVGEVDDRAPHRLAVHPEARRPARVRHRDRRHHEPVDPVAVAQRDHAQPVEHAVGAREERRLQERARRRLHRLGLRAAA
jgi:SAM-dependent methyltransferase